MDLKYASLSLRKLVLQRNSFICATILMLFCNFFLTLKIMRTQERIIMVPGIAQEMTLQGHKLSRSYIEETSLLFLSALLDLTADTIEYKKDMILKYTAHSHPGYLENIKKYFANAQNEYSKFGLSTHFTPKSLQINVKEMEVKAHGVMVASFGKSGYQSRHASYFISFDLIGGCLRMKEFYEIKEAQKNS